MNNIFLKIKKILKSFLKDPLFLRYWEDKYYSRPREDNQSSVRIIGRHKRQSFMYYGDSNMFIEDMYTGIMPFMLYQGEQEKYPTRLEPFSAGKEQIIADGISGRNYHNLLGDALCDFVRETTHILFQDGVIFYEIVYKKDKGGVVKEFGLELVQPFYLFKFFRNYYQFVPWREAKQSYLKVQIIKIPEEKILKIDFPERLGGRRKLKQVLKRLWELSRESIPKFQVDAVSKGEKIGFDFGKFIKNQYLEIAELTKIFGWNQRQLSGENITEYYSMVRFLREKKTAAIMRGEIISKLNQALNGSLLNFGVAIVIENLFLIEDVEKQEVILKKGDVTFMDIFNALKS